MKREWDDGRHRPPANWVFNKILTRKIPSCGRQISKTEHAAIEKLLGIRCAKDLYIRPFNSRQGRLLSHDHTYNNEPGCTKLVEMRGKKITNL
jgi:hypothetical protein